MEKLLSLVVGFVRARKIDRLAAETALALALQRSPKARAILASVPDAYLERAVAIVAGALGLKVSAREVRLTVARIWSRYELARLRGNARQLEEDLDRRF